MKKIVTGIAAIAMAASMFAVDISSMMQVDGDLLSYDGTNVKAIMEKGWDPSGDSDYSLKFSASLDKAGAEFWSWSSLSGTSGVAYSQWSLWLKPVDMLKVTIGHVGGASIAKPNFGWWAQTMNAWGDGVAAELKPIDNLTFNLALIPGNGNYFIDASQTGFDVLGNFWFDVTYGTDIGSFQFMASKGATVGAHGYSGWVTSPLAFGIAYANMPWQSTGYYADVAVSFKKDGDNLVFQGVDSQIGGQFRADALFIQLTNLIQYRDAFKYGFELKTAYTVDAFTPYIQIDGYDIMNSKLNVKLGVGTSVGACTIDAGINLPMDFNNFTFTFTVPVQFTVNL